MAVVLFRRSRQGIEATALGRLLIHRVAHLLDVLDHGPGHHAKEAPVLKIGYVSQGHAAALGQAFTQWRQLQAMTLRLLDVDTQEGFQGLQLADLDVLVLDEPGEGWHVCQSIKTQMVPVLRKNHPLFAQGKPLRAKDLEALEWILPTAQPSFHRALHRWLAQAGIESAVCRWQIPAGHGLGTVVAQSDTLTWLPAAQAHCLQQAGVLTTVRLVDAPIIEIPMYILLGAHTQADPVLKQGIEQFTHFLDNRSVGFGAQ